MADTAEVESRAGLRAIPGDPLALERQVCFALSVPPAVVARLGTSLGELEGLHDERQ